MVRKSRSFASPVVRDDSLVFTLVVKWKKVFPNTDRYRSNHPLSICQDSTRTCLLKSRAIEFICSERVPGTVRSTGKDIKTSRKELIWLRQRSMPDTIPKVTKALEGSFWGVNGLLVVMTKVVRRRRSSWSNPPVAGLRTVA